MARYVLHTTAHDGPTQDELALIAEHGQVLDRSRRALLIELDELTANELAEKLPGWSVQPEAIIPIPDLRKRVDD